MPTRPREHPCRLQYVLSVVDHDSNLPLARGDTTEGAAANRDPKMISLYRFILESVVHFPRLTITRRL